MEAAPNWDTLNLLCECFVVCYSNVNVFAFAINDIAEMDVYFEISRNLEDIPLEAHFRICVHFFIQTKLTTLKLVCNNFYRTKCFRNDRRENNRRKKILKFRMSLMRFLLR